MSRPRLAAACLTAVAAVAAAAVAHEARSVQTALQEGDAQFAQAPRAARWSANVWSPGGTAERAFGVQDDIALRRAVQAFVAAEATSAGPEDAERRVRARSVAEVALAGVAAEGSAAQASQAQDLTGVLVGSAGRVTGDLTADERSQAAFEAAVRADPSNADAKYNLELLLRRSRVVGVRKGPGSGSGSQRGGQRGAGSGTPGRGY